MTTFLVTGASGQLGQRVVDHLATLVDPGSILALVRSDEDAAQYADKGIASRRGDYDDRASLETAFAGVDRVLLISSSAVGERERQHGNVIAAAKAAGVGFIAYTSILGGPDNPMLLAREHIATEKMLADSGIAHTLLRNGWYIDNFLMGLDQALESGEKYGASGDGRFSAASRQDYAEAAARVLTGGHDGAVLELAGDTAFTMDEFTATVSKISGKPVRFVNVPQEALKQGMVDGGMPEPVAAIFADSDARAGDGALFDDSKTLSKLIGHPTTRYAEVLEGALKKA